MSCAAAIFVKTPGLSPLKTRLAAGIGVPAATDWYRLAARATAAVLAQLPGLAGYWAVAEPGVEAAAAWPGLPRVPQGPGTLGERMGRVHTTLAERHGSAFLLGADAPQLDPDVLARAVEWLAGPAPRLVLGPARDGGFWLLGANRVLPPAAWTAAPCGRPDTAAGFRAAMSGSGAWLELPSLTDVDAAGDLAPMLAELAALDRPLPEQRALADACLRHIG
ncbi:DUF2064 domain-containing protein [Thioalkalivibrio sp. XN8]|uniref:DUF2064 domain-containing protein n=1 Tax=Thioalkalivibrio sp. XN8 TaxID=2712863 RepID=UPI0013EBAD07|nr:DUF2064 domain-containing protein [Thioalkalivibrio sp. XN8]